MLVKEVLEKTTQFFRDKKIDSPRLDAELLLVNSLGLKNRVDLYLKFETPLKEDELSRCREAVRRRSNGEPIAYIVGSKGFYGLDFFVDADVLIPRPETEFLVEEGLKHLAHLELEALKIMDMGCGSGCIGLSVVKTIQSQRAQGKAFGQLQKIDLFLVDKSDRALAVAKRNATSLSLLRDANEQESTSLPESELQALAKKKFEGLEITPLAVSVHFVELDLSGQAQAFNEFDFDLILANPPYIAVDSHDVEANVKKHEPSMALFSDDRGYSHLKNWSKLAISRLKTNGFCGFEMGKDQSEEMVLYFKDLGFSKIQVIKDLAGFDRHITARKESNTNG